MHREFIIILFLVYLSGCTPCAETITIDNGKLPDSVLKFVPYQNGKIYRFQHSAGLIIEFTSSRQTTKELSRCEECCKYEYVYEVNKTRLVPDYPVFDFGFEISNQDTINYFLNAQVGKYQFYIPTSNKYPNDYYKLTDSILIEKKYYYDVFLLKSNYGSYYDKDLIYADSMFYSYRFGILQIKMSNGEKYRIYE